MILNKLLSHPLSASAFTLILMGCHGEATTSYQEAFNRISQMTGTVESTRLVVSNAPLHTNPTYVQRPTAATVSACWLIATQAMAHFSYGEVDCYTNDVIYSLLWHDNEPRIEYDGWIIPKRGPVRRLTRKRALTIPPRT